MMNEKDRKLSRMPGHWKDQITKKIRGMKRRRAEQIPDGEMVSLSSRLKLHWARAHKRTVFLIAGLVLLIGAAFLYGKMRVFRQYRILSSVERSDDSATHYVRLGSRMLKCNPNGVTCVNNANEILWNVTFTMQNPIVDLCDSVAVVGDQRGQAVYVFDKNGQIGHFEVEHTLQKVRVSSHGVVAAVLSDGEVTWINVYTSDGRLLVRTQTTMMESGYPLDIDLSANGQKMGVSYLMTDNRDIKTKLVFYNFSAVGQSEAGYVVNSEECEGIVVPQVSFLKDNYAVAFKDNGLVFFRGRQIPDKSTEIVLEEEILSAFHSDDYVGVITQSDEADQKHRYKMQVYRANGSKCGTRYFNMEYSDVVINGSQIILHGDHMVEIYGTDGAKEASVEYEKQIIDIIRIGGFRKYEIITPDSTDRIRLG